MKMKIARLSAGAEQKFGEAVKPRLYFGPHRKASASLEIVLQPSRRLGVALRLRRNLSHV
jgi:hypothetical protein